MRAHATRHGTHAHPAAARPDRVKKRAGCPQIHDALIWQFLGIRALLVTALAGTYADSTRNHTPRGRRHYLGAIDTRCPPDTLSQGRPSAARRPAHARAPPQSLARGAPLPLSRRAFGSGLSRAWRAGTFIAGRRAGDYCGRQLARMIKIAHCGRPRWAARPKQPGGCLHARRRLSLGGCQLAAALGRRPSGPTLPSDYDPSRGCAHMTP